jgi:hypothetical protein
MTAMIMTATIMTTTIKLDRSQIDTLPATTSAYSPNLIREKGACCGTLLYLRRLTARFGSWLINVWGQIVWFAMRRVVGWPVPRHA